MQHVYLASMCDTETVVANNEDEWREDLETIASPQVYQIAMDLTPEWEASLKATLIASILEAESDPSLEHDWEWIERHRTLDDELSGVIEVWRWELRCNAFGGEEPFGLIVVQKRKLVDAPCVIRRTDGKIDGRA